MTDTSKKLKRLKQVNRILRDSLRECAICPRRCKVDRTALKLGYCRAGYNPKVYSHYPHHGEEPPISGTTGSGVIFFSYCNMKCVYCQNYYFSQLDKGQEISTDKLSGMMLELEQKGCHNINLVTPTHFVPQILSALEMATEKGLTLPIVYNTSGYELAETIKLLDGVVDIYLTDMRYSDDDMAKRYSDAVKYTEFNRSAVSTMQQQVGDLVLDSHGIAQRGLIIRLLALPGDVSGIKKTLNFIKDNISKNTHLSVMSQYYPTYKAYSYTELSRGITQSEYKFIIDEAAFLGLNNGWIQQIPSTDNSNYFGTSINPDV